MDSASNVFPSFSSSVTWGKYIPPSPGLKYEMAKVVPGTYKFL